MLKPLVGRFSMLSEPWPAARPAGLAYGGDRLRPGPGPDEKRRSLSHSTTEAELEIEV